MKYQDNTRLHLISEILGAKSQSSLAFSKYMAADRKYEGEDTLHMREAHLIVAIAPGEGKTMTELSEHLGVTQGAVSQTASRLEKKGYILRSRSSFNHRQIVAVLTEKGEAFYHHHLGYDNKRFSYLNNEYFSGYSDDQLRLIRDYELLMCAVFTKENEKK